MAFPELHFFDGAGINGATLLELPVTNSYVERVTARVALREVGSLQLRLSRQLAETLVTSAAFKAENFVRLLVPAISTTRYVHGGFLGQQVRQLVARIAAGEDIAINADGPAWYLTRAILWDQQFSQDADRPYRIDLANGVFRFEGDADAGNVLSRLDREDNNNTIAEFLPAFSKTFDHATDSNGDPWADAVGSDADPFELPIGQNFLDDTFAVLEAVPALDMTWDLGTVASPKLEMSVWQGLTGYARDLVPASTLDFSADVVHFKKGKNISGDVQFVTAGRRKATHALAIGSDGHYGRAVRSSYVVGGYAKAIGIDRSHLHWEPALDRAAARYLAHQQLGEQEITLVHYPGFAPTSGRYFPGPEGTNGHYWIGDSIGLTTGSSPIDLEAASELVTAIGLDLAAVVKDGNAEEGALSWNLGVELNIERNSASAPTQESGGTAGGCNCPQLCHPTIEGTADTVDQFLNAQDPGGTSANWVGNLENQGGSGDGANGTDWYNFKSGGSPNRFQDSKACNAGDTIRVSGWWGCRSHGNLQLAFSTVAGGTSGATVQGAIIGSAIDLHPPGPGHTHADQWTAFIYDAVAPAGTNSYALGITPSLSVDFDEVTVTVLGDPGSNPYSGTDARAARCDHVHPASEIVFTPTSSISSDNVQDAIEEVVSDLTAAFGDRTLDDLIDVTITSVADGDVLTYDSATSEWINSAGGSGASVDVSEDGTPVVSAATEVSFVGADFDVTDGGSGEADVAIAAPSAITPTQLSANTDDWNPTGLSSTDIIRASTDASRNLTGITAPSVSRAIVLENIGSNDLVLVHNATSTAANRFFLPGDANLTLTPDSAVMLVYDTTSTRWRAVGGVGAAGSVDAAGVTFTPSTPMVTTNVQDAIDELIGLIVLPLTATVGGEGVLVFDENDSLIGVEAY